MDEVVRERVESFLESWEIEIRAGYTPEEDFDLEERFFGEHLGMTLDPALEQTLIADLSRATEGILARERALERGWLEPTTNDRVRACFRELDEHGIVALECAGKTIQDGWGYIGLNARPDHRGAVFFHQEDVFDGVRDHGLPLAFGGTGSAPMRDEDAHELARVILEALSRHGVEAWWSGSIEDRIEIAPFAWRRRRFTDPPPIPASNPLPLLRSERRPRLHIDPSALEPYQTTVWAYRTTFGFDAQLSFAYRGAWITLGGERGQIAHVGDPHIFVPAGGTTVLGLREAYANLPEHDAAALRARALASRV